jgi:hypothetical protein
MLDSDSDCECSVISLNVGNSLLIYTASNPERLESSAMTL